MSKPTIYRLFVALLVLIFVVTACTPAQEPPAAPTQPEGQAPEPTAADAQPEPAQPTNTVAAPDTEQPAPGADYSRAAREDTVIFDIDGGRVNAPDLWNPFVPGARRDHGFHQAVMEPLFILNYESGEIEPWLGESMTANDTLDVWTLKLHEGITWSDGEPMTADDVIFTIDMIKATPEFGDSANMNLWVQEMRKIDDLTVEFVLNDPNPRFQLDYFSVKIWGSISVMPQHIWEGQDPLTFKNYDPAQGWPVFSGPYKLDSISETEFSYVRNDDWWGAATGFKPLPQPHRLIWTWAGPEETRTALMANAQLDSLMDITLGAFQALQSRNPNVVAWFAEEPYAWLDPCARTFEFNTTMEPWNDKEMRWAINYLINRDQIVNIAYENTTQASRSFFPAYPPLNRYLDLLANDENFANIHTFDPARAHEIIQSKGWTRQGDGYYTKDGQELAFIIETHEAFIEKQRIAQVLVEQFQREGINVTTRNIAGGTWGDNLQFGTFETRMGWQHCGSINEPWASLDTLSNRWIEPVGERASANGWRWDNAEYSQAVERIGTLPLGDPEIDQLVTTAMTIYYDELPTIPITQAKKLIPFDNTYWTNWPTAENNYIHSTTWWQSTLLILVNLEKAQ
jgi:peptide/nickel transport system substrate-binding protein